MFKNRQQQGTAFDLILIDWLLPEIDGLEVSRRIRETTAISPPIILMSAFAGDMEKVEAEKIGIQGFLIKPIYQTTLFNAIMAAFGKEPDQTLSPRKQVMTADISVYKQRLKGFKVLVVEDNPINQQIAVAILKNARIITDTAINGQKAVAKVLNKPYDAVLMDIRMPKMDGYQATRKIRTELSLTDLPIIAMTAHAMRGDKEKCMAAGMDGYVAKPVDQSLLFQELWRLLKNRRPVSEEVSRSAEFETNTQMSKMDTRKLPEQVPGIYIQETLDHTGIEPAVYKSILYDFRKNNLDTAEALQKALDNNDTNRMVMLAHNLKGSGGNIGARDLQLAAKKLEDAARNSSDRSVLKPLVKSVSETLGVVLSSITKLERVDTAESSLDTGVSDDVMDDHLFRDLLDKLAEALGQADPEKINRILFRLKGAAQWQNYSEIENFIKHYDYDKALEILTKTER
jgi:CheY-like chemotaxis protein/HPt (histidine-containing phosphotransfer) domain-containing protein